MKTISAQKNVSIILRVSVYDIVGVQTHKINPWVTAKDIGAKNKWVGSISGGGLERKIISTD